MSSALSTICNQLGKSKVEKLKLDMADIFRFHSHKLGILSWQKQKVVKAITACRTAALGGHIYECDRCDNREQSYNSCRNRHCIKCQFAAKREWVEERAADLLPVCYYHVVFTIPHEFNELILTNKKAIYDILFRASSATLKEVFRRKYQADPGMIAVLHTWGQNLSLHPHIHMVIPGGGLADGDSRWVHTDEKFFLNVRALGSVFRAKFIKMMRRAYSKGQLKFLDINEHLADRPAFQDLLDTTFKQDWNVYAKKPFQNPMHVLKYLGGYTHRIAFANHRLLEFDGDTVRFKIRDRQAEKEGKSASTEMTLPTVEFMRRFLLHVVPRGFMRIRHYGILGSSRKKTALEAARKLLPESHDKGTKSVAEMVAEFAAASPVTSDDCQKCKTGKMLPIETIMPVKITNST